LRNADEKLFSKTRSSNHSIHQLLPPAKTLPMKLSSTIVCLLSHNVITTCINLHLFCEICFWTLIEIFCFHTMFIIFVRWRLSVGIKRFTYLFTYLGWHVVCVVDYQASSVSYFCVSQGNMATLFKRGGRVYNILMWNFLRILSTKNYWNRFSFYWVIRNIKSGRF